MQVSACREREREWERARHDRQKEGGAKLLPLYRVQVARDKDLKQARKLRKIADGLRTPAQEQELQDLMEQEHVAKTVAHQIGPLPRQPERERQGPEGDKFQDFIITLA